MGVQSPPPPFFPPPGTNDVYDAPSSRSDTALERNCSDLYGLGGGGGRAAAGSPSRPNFNVAYGRCEKLYIFSLLFYRPKESGGEAKPHSRADVKRFAAGAISISPLLVDTKHVVNANTSYRDKDYPYLSIANGSTFQSRRSCARRRGGGRRSRSR